ncbi:MAG: multiple sugar transporter permease [Marmoricola sp.]|jgi:multiple sugar transport system permease protein|nr:multiple sugar transporter permease [Marmoricola sp.]
MSIRRKVVVHVAAVVLAAWTLIPLVWVAIVSITPPNEFASRPLRFWPKVPDLTNYPRLLGREATSPSGKVLEPSGHSSLIVHGLINSAEVAVVVTAISLIVCVPAAYALARLNLRWREAGLLTIIATRALPPIATTIPFFALFSSLGLSGTRTGLVITHLTITVPLLVWIGTSFFASLPAGLERMARVDGCSRFRAVTKVVVPASGPSITAMAVIAFLTSWNEFTFALIFNTGSTAQTFPPALASMFFQVSVPTEVAAATCLGLLPPLLLAAVFQRYIRRVNFVGIQ